MATITVLITPEEESDLGVLILAAREGTALDEAGNKIVIHLDPVSKNERGKNGLTMTMSVEKMQEWIALITSAQAGRVKRKGNAVIPCASLLAKAMGAWYSNTHGEKVTPRETAKA